MTTLETAAPDLSNVQFSAASPDPFRPADLVIPSGVTSAPPCCPICFALLHSINQNASGDLLLECLADHVQGYQAVYRSATRQYEQRPGHELRRWAPPLTLTEVRQRAAKRGV